MFFNTLKFCGFVALSGLSSSAFARELPQVQCELMYSLRDANGSTVDFRRGEPVTLTTGGSQVASNNGFRLAGSLERICASDGGPCTDAQTLTVTISKGESQSLLSVTVPADAEYQRWSTALVVGSEDGFANCDIVR